MLNTQQVSRNWQFMRNLIYSVIFSSVFLLAIEPVCCSQANVLDQLEKYLKANGLKNIAEQDWSTKALTKEQCENAKRMLVDTHFANLRKERQKEWTDKVIEIGDHSMKFEYKVFGEKPKNGRSLFISMHGGGGTSARVNDRQWKNQIGLYRPEEGVYLAPRAPTDKWNLWHQSHIDPMFTRIIENAIVFQDVNPNRVFIMGYSAGGDGVYQLAPRMADQLAAAAMMAGHPNNANPLGLRNIGFTLHMGGKDAAFKRNKIAEKWKTRLKKLQDDDPDGYRHKVVIHEKHGHWMNRDDAVAVPWMAEFTRNPIPTKVVWVQSGVTHDRFYWLAVDKENKKSGSLIVASRTENRIVIERSEGVESLTILINDEMLDMDQQVTLSFNGVDTAAQVDRTISTLAQTLTDRSDPASMYSGAVKLKTQTLPEP